MLGIKTNKVKGNDTRFAAIRPASAWDEINLRVAQAGNNAVDVYVYDVIGWPYIEAQDLLYQIPRGAETINVHLNTPGGDVFEGMAIFNLLSSHQANINIIVDSLAASSGSLIAMAGNTITMRPASFIMIHNGWSRIAGDADELRAEADLLDKICGVFADAYSQRSGKDRKEILDMMSAETWFTPDEAVAAGFADAIDAGNNQSASTPRACFDLSVFANAPEALRAASAGKTAASGSGPAGPRRGYINNSNQEVDMNKKLRALLERLGLSKDATDEQAFAFLADVNLDQITVADERAMVETALEELTGGQPPTPQAPSASFSQADIDEAIRQAGIQERRRQTEIREAVTIARLDMSVADDLINRGVSIDQARAAIMDQMRTVNPPIGAGAIALTADERDKFRAAVVDGIGFRCGLRAEKPAPGFEQFRSASIEYVARVCLERSGVDTRGLASRRQVVDTILRQASTGTFTTDDFSNIFLDVSHKTLLQAYQEAPCTWRPIVRIVSASDFKEMHGISLSAAPDLQLIGQNGEYKSGDMKDAQESYHVRSYGLIVYLTRVMMINDDLRAFTRFPQLFGSSARRKESDLVWVKITGNPVMNDGKTLFHADHKNLETDAADKGPVDSEKLSAARKDMRKQKGLKGEKLDLRPRYLLVPVAQETDVDVLLLSSALPKAEMSAGVHNPWAGKLEPISEPRLDDVSENAWYLSADPNQIDTIEVAYLDGQETPYIEEQMLFERDAIGHKVRHDFGVGIMDHRGLFKNPGE